MTKMKWMVALGAATLGTIGLSAPASAADNVMQVCGAKYQAAKKANQLPAGQTWNQYLAQCRAGMKGSAPAAAPAPAPKPVAAAKAAPHPAGQPSAAQQAMYARERQCGQMWKADKAAHKIPANQTWPQYWSACNKRVKG
jgi:hypothetical protein